MKLYAVYADSMYMFIDNNIENPTQKDKCKVYNATTDVTAPELCIGSWAARMGPWRFPTDEEKRKWDSRI